LNERSVVMDTESSPTSSPFTYSENQLSAHTSAVNVLVAPTTVVESTTAVVTGAVVTGAVVAGAVVAGAVVAGTVLAGAVVAADSGVSDEQAARPIRQIAVVAAKEKGRFTVQSSCPALYGRLVSAGYEPGEQRV
jgi:hypothetical protein